MQEAAGEPFVLQVQCCVSEGEDVFVLFPPFDRHPLPDVSGEVVQADVERGNVSFLVKAPAATKVVPPHVEREAEGGVLNFLEAAYGCFADGMGGDGRVCEDGDDFGFDNVSFYFLAYGSKTVRGG